MTVGAPGGVNPVIMAGGGYVRQQREKEEKEKNNRLRQSLSKQPGSLFVTDLNCNICTFSLEISLPLHPGLYANKLSTREIKSIQSSLKSAWDGDYRNCETVTLSLLCGVAPFYLCWLPSLMCNGGVSEFQRALSKINRDLHKKGLYFQFEKSGSNHSNFVGFLTLHQV